jgi:hypothetical protein
LSPLLFNIYITDIMNYEFKGNIFNYADDTMILLPHKNITIATTDIQNDVDLITKYFHNNYIHINNKKTKAILFKNTKTKIDILKQENRIISHKYECFKQESTCECEKLRYSDTVKYLGLNFDSNMNWHTHAQTITNKLRFLALRCYQLKEMVPFKIKRAIYFSLVEAQIRYGISLYGFAPNYILNPIICQTNRIIRTLFSGVNNKDIGILNFKNLQTQIILLTHYFDNRYRNVQKQNHNLRQTKYIIAKAYTNIGERVPEYFVPKILNSLPDNLKHFNKYSNIKKEIKIHLLNMQ